MTATDWRFDNSYARLPEAFFARLPPTPVRGPAGVVLNHRLAERLGLTLDEHAVAALAGNVVPEGAEPIAQAYAGHQFGNFTMLGDGRAILIGEHVAPDGQRFDIQLKGSGPTPFSRRGDGRAALGPMLREYLVSEAMHALGIPTTRSLAVVATGEAVLREELLAGAVLTRVAASHLRVGTFEYAAARGDVEALRELVSYALARHYPELQEAENPALALLDAVIARQAALVAEWMRVGFIHGVMNTDNMTISGETIDYGPCAFLDAYHPMTAFSSIDTRKRYAFGNQPPIAQWNLARLAESLLALIDPDEDKAVEIASDRIAAFKPVYEESHAAMMRRKLGFAEVAPGDGDLAAGLLEWMREREADYTNTFRAISEDGKPVAAAGDEAFAEWHRRWLDRHGGDLTPAAIAIMQAANPAIIPRNHKVEEALDAATQAGNLALFNRMLEALAEPYRKRPGFEDYLEPMPETAGPYRTYCGT